MRMLAVNYMSNVAGGGRVLGQIVSVGYQGGKNSLSAQG